MLNPHRATGTCAWINTYPWSFNFSDLKGFSALTRFFFYLSPTRANRRRIKLSLSLDAIARLFALQRENLVGPSECASQIFRCLIALLSVVDAQLICCLPWRLPLFIYPFMYAEHKFAYKFATAELDIRLDVLRLLSNIYSLRTHARKIYLWRAINLHMM